MDMGGVRRKMPHRNCERINAVKMMKVYNRYGKKKVNGYGFKNNLVCRKTTVFLNGTETL